MVRSRELKKMVFNIDSFEEKSEECNFCFLSLLFSIENQRCHSRIQSSFGSIWQCQDCQEQQLQSICKSSISSHPLQNFDQDLCKNLGKFLAGEIAEILAISAAKNSPRISARFLKKTCQDLAENLREFLAAKILKSC